MPHRVVRELARGSQFTGSALTGVLADNGIAISVDGKRAWRERLRGAALAQKDPLGLQLIIATGKTC